VRTARSTPRYRQGRRWRSRSGPPRGRGAPGRTRSGSQSWGSWRGPAAVPGVPAAASCFPASGAPSRRGRAGAGTRGGTAVIINCSAVALGSAGAGVGRSTAQALLLKAISVQSRSWSRSSTLELTQLSRSAEHRGHQRRLHRAGPQPAPLPSLANASQNC